MIPKHIHYFWFGAAEQTELIKKCLASWQEFLPDYTLTLWNESNYDVHKNTYTNKAFTEKKWAFLSDYARLDVLHEHGGIYMDTDMEVLKSLDEFLQHGVFIGMESATHINASIVGATPKHWYIKEVLNSYNHNGPYVTIPVKMTNVLQKYISVQDTRQDHRDIAVYPHEYFYPFGFTESFSPSCITENTHTVHWWDHSWGSRKAKWLKRFGLLGTAQWVKSKIT